MKKGFAYRFVGVVLFTLCTLSGFSQSSFDNKIANYPTRFASYEDLANRIKTDFSGEEERAKAAFAWIAQNIAYKTKGINKVQKVRFSYTTEADLKAQKEQFRRELAQKTIRGKKALCEGYATLYQEICSLMNIECVIVPGIAKRFVSEIGNSQLPSNHAWNAVKINGTWQLVDITWAAGSVDYAKMQFIKEYTPGYFASDPKEFAMKHYPDDKKWLLLKGEFSKEQFAQQPTVFNHFIGKNYKINMPNKGLLSIKKGSDIQFIFSHIPKEIQIAYHFKKDKFGQLVKPIRKKEKVTFEVPTNLRGKDELIIYFNNEAVLGYKISIK